MAHACHGTTMPDTSSAPVEEKKRSRKRKKPKTFGYYGYDPSIYVFEGDPRLSPPPPWFGVNYHPSQPISNSWQEWSGADMAMFDISTNQMVPISNESSIIRDSLKRRKHKANASPAASVIGGGVEVPRNGNSGSTAARSMTLHPFQPTRNEWSDWLGHNTPSPAPSPSSEEPKSARSSGFPKSDEPQYTPSGGLVSASENVEGEKKESRMSISIIPYSVAPLRLDEPVEGFEIGPDVRLNMTSATLADYEFPQPEFFHVEYNVVPVQMPRVASGPDAGKPIHLLAQQSPSILLKDGAKVEQNGKEQTDHRETKGGEGGDEDGGEVNQAIRNKNLSKLNRMRKFMYSETIAAHVAHLEELIRVLQKALQQRSEGVGQLTAEEQGKLNLVLSGDSTLGPIQSHLLCEHMKNAKAKTFSVPEAKDGFQPYVAWKKLVNEIREKMDKRRMDVFLRQSAEDRAKSVFKCSAALESTLQEWENQVTAILLLVRGASVGGGVDDVSRGLFQSIGGLDLRVQQGLASTDVQALLRDKFELMILRRIVQSATRLLLDAEVRETNEFLKKTLSKAKQTNKLLTHVAANRMFVDATRGMDELLAQAKEILHPLSQVLMETDE